MYGATMEAAMTLLPALLLSATLATFGVAAAQDAVSQDYQSSSRDDVMNRLGNFPASSPAELRRAWLDRAIAAVTTQRSAPLDAVEHATAVALLQTEPDALVRERLWRLLANSMRAESAVALAKRVVVEPEYSPRWSAFQYLRQHEPSACEALVQVGLARPDADLLYVVGDFVMQTDHRRGLAMIMDVLRMTGDHRLSESASLMLAMQGGETELAELRRRVRESGDHSVYRDAAEMLASELERKSGKHK
jgi:hypothetical protein